ncbi:hypothetical protein PYW07_011145 [Mythimna separata]|uniref:FP protein C-terminal domain-containing protein n=1 Tax=Mythimna separata TaxID=271217 RepID=A0AAD7Y7I4_MYTSE|nr:hypothetical protein PYW07_011145 [Mythimna separata]
MPINRTPPPVALPLFTNSTSSESLAPVMMHEATLHQCQSAPDLSKIPTNITERKKRKYEGKADKGPVTLSTFNTSSGDQEFRFEDLMEKIDSIIVQNSELKHSVEVMSSKYDEFLGRVATLEAERIEDKKKIQLLEEKAFQRSHGYQFCWTANGVVYLRKKVNDPQIRITSEADVEKLKCTE